MKCQMCGFENDDNAVFCGKCGIRLPIQVEKKNKISATKTKNRKKRRYIFLILFTTVLIGCGIAAVIIFGITKPSEENAQIILDIEDGKSEATDYKNEKENIQEMEEMRKAAEQVIRQQKAQKGSVSGQVFLSCATAKVQDFPQSEQGYINHIMTDLDGDGIDELLLTYFNGNNHELYLSYYRYADGKFHNIFDCGIGELNCFSQITLYLYYDRQRNEPCIFYSNNTVGSYSGERGFTARLYGIEDDDIELIAGWEWDSALSTVLDCEEIRQDMQSEGVPYLEAGRESFGMFDAGNLTMLAKSDIQVQGDVPSLYMVYLHIYSEEQLK